MSDDQPRRLRGEAGLAEARRRFPVIDGGKSDQARRGDAGRAEAQRRFGKRAGNAHRTGNGGGSLGIGESPDSGDAA